MSETSSGTGLGGTEAIETISVTQVVWMGLLDSDESAAMAARSAGVGCWLVRAVRSPAISERASRLSVARKISLNPRTPTRAATPMVTESTTKRNFPGAERRSRIAMEAARCQVSACAAISDAPQ